MIVSLDPGYGNTKVCSNGETAVVQSAIAHPRQIGMAGAGMRTSARGIEIALPEGGEYMVGEGVWRWGEPLGAAGLDYSNLASEARRVLFYAAASRLLPPGSYDIDLVIGLPVPLLQEATRAAALKEQLVTAYKRGHHFYTPRGAYLLVVRRLVIAAQPVGAYMDWRITAGLTTRKVDKTAEVAILDLGMNTLDLFVGRDGEMIPRYIGGGRVGVYRLLEQIAPRGMDLEEMDAELRLGHIRPGQTELSTWLGEVLGVVSQAWPQMSRFAAVVPAGGGALLLGEALRKALESRGAVVAWPDDPITTNARGLWKYGEKVVRK